MICHGHWTVNGAKMSKSKGNYVPLRSLRQFVSSSPHCDVD